VSDRAARDQWASWILERRFGGDAEAADSIMRQLTPVRDRVLRASELTEGDVLLDVGAGDGLIAFGALPLVGETGKVVFSDVSQDLLDVSRELAERAGALDRAEFVQAAAEDLAPIADESVDVVTTRSVVIYVTDKQRAFDEFHRVLRPGGRLSMFEPINSFSFPEPDDRLWGFDITPVSDLKRKVRASYERLSGGADSTLTDFDERDLLTFAERAGFKETKLSYEATVAHGGAALCGSEPLSWDAFLTMAPNPHAPSLAEAIEDALTPAEAERFLAHVRHLHEAREGTNRSAVAYLRAVK
jgi:arsenite methyltransferase